MVLGFREHGWTVKYVSINWLVKFFNTCHGSNAGISLKKKQHLLYIFR